MPCGVWEAVYIIEGLLEQESEAASKEIHADTQGQSFPVFGLAHLFGFELLPRIRNFRDLIFHRPEAGIAYRHIDALLRGEGETVQRADVAIMSLYQQDNVRRFGDYIYDLNVPLEGMEVHLDIEEQAA